LNINPSWSPDGSRLVFQSARYGQSELYVIGVDGSGERRLTHNLADDTHPAWSPDGSTIVFDSFRDGIWNLLHHRSRR
jgi:TolB protein